METPGIDFRTLAMHGEQPLTFKAGDVIFRAGDQGTVFYVVENGTVEIRRGTRVLDKVAHGEIFGEMALIDNSPRAADAVAATEVRVFCVNERRFLFLIAEMPYFGLSVMRVLSRRLRAATSA